MIPAIKHDQRKIWTMTQWPRGDVVCSETITLPSTPHTECTSLPISRGEIPAGVQQINGVCSLDSQTTNFRKRGHDLLR